MAVLCSLAKDSYTTKQALTPKHTRVPIVWHLSVPFRFPPISLPWIAKTGRTKKGIKDSKSNFMAAKNSFNNRSNIMKSDNSMRTHNTNIIRLRMQRKRATAIYIVAVVSELQYVIFMISKTKTKNLCTYALRGH